MMSTEGIGSARRKTGPSTALSTTKLTWAGLARVCASAVSKDEN